MEGKTNEKVENLVKVPLYKKTWVRVLAILLAVVLAVSGVLVNGYISDVRIAESADEMTKKLAEREELQNQWTPVVGEELIRALREQGKHAYLRSGRLYLLQPATREQGYQRLRHTAENVRVHGNTPHQNPDGAAGCRRKQKGPSRNGSHCGKAPEKTPTKTPSRRANARLLPVCSCS